MAPLIANSSLVESIGWLLVHSLWQFAAIGLVAAALLWLLRRASAETRYWSSLIALCAIVTTPLITWCYLPMRISPGLSGMRTTAEIAPPEGKSIDRRETQSQPLLVVEPDPAAVQPRIESASEFVRRADPLVWPIRWLSVERMITPWLPVIVLTWCGGGLLFALGPRSTWLAIRQLRARGLSC